MKEVAAAPQLLDLIPNWPSEEHSSEEKQLELRLGPPGDDDHHQDWRTINNKTNSSTTTPREEERDKSSILSLANFSSSDFIMPETWINGDQRYQKVIGTSTMSPSSPWSSSSQYYHKSLTPPMDKESLQRQQACCGISPKVELHNTEKEKKAFSIASANINIAVTNNSHQKRSAPAPVVGWPPIRSFRKNLASSSSSKLPAEAQNAAPQKNASEKQAASCRKGLFVKINMDGVPIGRKVDLNICENYEKLSCVVDDLFKGLLAAQRDSSAQNTQAEEKTTMRILDGGEYNLVYEDNEGDRMLVGDVPWNMFLSTVKRLRVLKSSELSSSLCVGGKQGKNQPDAAAARLK